MQRLQDVTVTCRPERFDGKWRKLLGVGMKLLKKLFKPEDSKALIYQAGAQLEDVTLRWPVIECSGEQAAAVIAKEANNRDHTPVILGPTRSLQMMMSVEQPRPVKDILQRASKFDFDAYMRQAKQEWAELNLPVRGSFAEFSVVADAIDAASIDVVRNAPYKKLYIGLVPTSDPTEVPAYLDCGAWNAFPEAEVHIGLMRRWRDRYGARLIGHSNDTLTFHVLRPPLSQNEALALAEEHYAYCNDIVDQGYGTLDALAGALIGSETWQFWWD